MFRTVFPSIFGSSRLYMQQQAFVKHRVPASKQTALSVWQMPVAVCTVLYSDDGRKDLPKHVECRSKINNFGTLVYLVVLL